MLLRKDATPEEALEYINGILRKDLRRFIQYSFSYLRPGEKYSHSWHIDAISEYLQAVKDGEMKRLIINMPPRMMKSLTASVAFPAWLIGNDPTTSIICASYAQTLSNQHSLDCRAIMESEWFKSAFQDCRLAKDQNEKSKYKTTLNGMRFATSVGGTLTGAGGSCFPAGTLVCTSKGNVIIEKVVKNPCEYKVLSYNHSKGKEEYKNVIASRKLSKRGLYEIQTTQGVSLRCTGDHPIYVQGIGYVEAEKLKPGQSVYHNRYIQNSNEVGIFHAQDQNMVWSGMRNLCQNISDQIRCFAQEFEKRICRQLLFAGMLGRASCNKEFAEMFDMRKQSAESRETLLFRPVQRGSKTIASKDISSRMHKLFTKICSEICVSNVLRQGMCGLRAQKTYARVEQFQLSSWQRISEIFQKIKSYYTGKRWKYLSRMWNIREIIGTSRESQQTGQCGGESHHFMQGMSYDSSSQQDDTISSVKRISDQEHEVYDIQIEGNHNFFAEGLLVHNCIIVDDPLDPNRAASDVEREKANNWMSATVPSRLNNPEKDSIIVVMQRLHEEDVTGYLLDKGGWDHLCLPAENDRKTIIQMGKFKKVFEDGELLHPQRLPKKILKDLEHDLGSYAYAGQYLQTPIPKGGGILQADWWREWKTYALPPCDYIVQVYDTAFKIGNNNDYSARTTWGIFQYNNRSNIILLEAMNLRLTLPDLKAEAIESYKDYDPDIVLIEDKASGISLIQELKRTGMRIKALKRGAGDDKVSRAHIASVMLEQSVVWYPRECPWVNEVIRQCASFPNAKHDDLVDTVTDALIFLRHYKKLEVNNDQAISQGSTTFKPNYGGHYG